MERLTPNLVQTGVKETDKEDVPGLELGETSVGATGSIKDTLQELSQTVLMRSCKVIETKVKSDGLGLRTTEGLRA